ncbi:MAG: S-methyl-5-thioribose-1-phosphate isomerase, partial [Oscillospiraceae bacterium]|nr:S-methyl-5-thioribose-1-phosphate isomerase [Oscillospiraceae bacterium]
MMDIDTVSLDELNNALVIIDQRELPNNVSVISLTTQDEIWKAIHTLRVRGAPAIGVAAAFGLFLASEEIKETSYDSFYSKFKASLDYLASSRPTAVNLFWALDRMEQVVLSNSDKTVTEIKTLLKNEARSIKNEDIEVCAKIGEHGLSLLKSDDGILTYCNAGQLAAVK